MDSKDESIKVAVRVRPLVSSEIDRGCHNVLSKTSNASQILLKSSTTKQNEMFTFNFVFDASDSQEVFYINAIEPILHKLFEGYNVTIFAYGQTGSGKTHTMGTAYNGNTDEQTGVIPRAINDIFRKVNNLSEYTFEVSCSFMELYQEELYDLLSDKTREDSVVEIQEDKIKGIGYDFD